jgi:DNA repair protein RadD
MTTLFDTPQPKQSFDLRYYQREAIDACYYFLRAKKTNPCIVLPTGAGKTPVLSTICHDAVTRWNGRVLVVSHVKELVEQSAATLQSWYPELKVGVYSAGLGRRETLAEIVVAGIQSVYDKGLKLAGSDPFKLVLVDEAHRIPTSGEGMYRRLLTDLQVAAPKIRVIGLTATPYRLKGGLVCAANHFLNEICYEVGVRELIAKGYLCPLVSKQAVGAIHDEQLRVKNGEFDDSSLAEAFDGEEIVRQAVAEIAAYAANRKSLLVFCCDVTHAGHVTNVMREVLGEEVGLVTGETATQERDRTLQRFKDGALRFLVNVNVLTEGFDARRVDCVVLLRATLSPGLYYQMVGRGLRLHDDKSDCLVLDFGSNVLRHGCIDAINVKSPSSGNGNKQPGSAPAKECPKCHSVQSINARECLDCGFEFPQDLTPNHEERASDLPITTDQVSAVEYQVTSVSYLEHTKRDADESAPKTLRVMYYDGLSCVAQEWVCVEHSGRAGESAWEWWTVRTDKPLQASAAACAKIAELGYLAEPTSITVVKQPGQKFPRITKYILGPRVVSENIQVAVDEWGDEVRVDIDDSDAPF